MRLALSEAQRAAEEGEVPVGAVVFRGDDLVGRGRNQRESARDPLGHAELIAIRESAASLGQWRLSETTLYVTLEPCAMCAGAIVNSRIERVVYGAADPKAGAVESLYQILTDQRLNHRVKVCPGVLAEPCGEILRSFFRARR